LASHVATTSTCSGGHSDFPAGRSIRSVHTANFDGWSSDRSRCKSREVAAAHAATIRDKRRRWETSQIRSARDLRRIERLSVTLDGSGASATTGATPGRPFSPLLYWRRRDVLCGKSASVAAVPARTSRAHKLLADEVGRRNRSRDPIRTQGSDPSRRPTEPRSGSCAASRRAPVVPVGWSAWIAWCSARNTSERPTSGGKPRRFRRTSGRKRPRAERAPALIANRRRPRRARADPGL
jgi:hypothetical protein